MAQTTQGGCSHARVVIVEYPTIAKRALEHYGDLYASELLLRHFGECLTGLMIAERKTVFGIHREFADIADQSCLKRFLTEVDWDAQALNVIMFDPSTRSVPYSLAYQSRSDRIKQL